MRVLPDLVFNTTSRSVGYLCFFGAGITLGFLAFAIFLAGDLYDYKDTVLLNQAILPQVDAIVVLGGGKGRITAGGDLWYRYWEDTRQIPTRLPTLYFSGV